VPQCGAGGRGQCLVIPLSTPVSTVASVSRLVQPTSQPETRDTVPAAVSS
jgi:hypothetical protein